MPTKSGTRKDEEHCSQIHMCKSIYLMTHLRLNVSPRRTTNAHMHGAVPGVECLSRGYPHVSTCDFCIMYERDATQNIPAPI